MLSDVTFVLILVDTTLPVAGETQCRASSSFRIMSLHARMVLLSPWILGQALSFAVCGSIGKRLRLPRNQGMILTCN